MVPDVLVSLDIRMLFRGKRDSALLQLKRLNELSNEKVVDPCFIAWIYTGLGRKRESI